MQEIHNLRAQICNIVASTFPGTDSGLRAPLTPPNDRQVRIIHTFVVVPFL